jgi:prophage antirepressor-like protein
MPLVNGFAVSYNTQTLEDNVYLEDKAALQTLIDVKGWPLGGGIWEIPPLGHNELKAIHINEPALYSLIFGSRKQEAKDFKRWVCTAVLPCIRRKGFFGNFAVTLKARDEELQLALKARDDELQLALKARDDRVLQQLGRQCDRVVSAMQDSLRALIPNFSASLSQAVCFSLAQKFKDLRDDFRAAVSSPTGAFIVALRKAVKLPAMKRTTNPEKFPEEQHATPDEERFVESLSTLLTEELERLASQNSIFHAGGLPPLSYGAWKRCRTLVGSRCLALRQLTGTPPSPSCGVAQRAAVASTAAANITST